MKRYLLLLLLLLVGCGNASEKQNDFIINASKEVDVSQAIPLFKTLAGHCPGIYKYKDDIAHVEYLGETSFDLTIKQRPTLLPLDSAPMNHTCHFQVSESEATVSKRPCAWLCTGNNMTGIDGEDHSYAKGNLIGPLKREWTNLQEAIANTRLDMADFNDASISLGAANLAIWSAKHMSWADLQKVDQGKYGMVMKDPDSQRGKRLCAYGKIVEIHVDNSAPKKLYWGGMTVFTDDGMRIHRFIAAGSTGELVAGNEARFCGIVTGINSYSNSAGGMSHAVHEVGMFELPENKISQK